MLTLDLGQLVYTSFPDHGFQTLSSADVSEEVTQIFLTQVVYKYWNSYAPPQPGYRAAYLTQVSIEQTLFGWMYNQGADELGRSHVPYFLAYCLRGKLDHDLLESIYSCLERGPVTFIDRQSVTPVIDKVVIDDIEQWHPILPGVTISSGTRARCRLLLNQDKLLSFSVAIPTEVQTPQGVAKPWSNDLRLDAIPLPSDFVDNQPLLNSLERLLESPRLTLDSMARVPTSKNALLIGVSHCEQGFEPLPGVQDDLMAMKQVLEYPKIAGFDEVEVLLNPNPQVLAESLEAFCQDRAIDDLVVIYYSGYGVILDDHGRFGLTTSLSRLNPEDKIVRSTLVSADLLQDILNDCRAEQQIVLLDCCYRQTASSVLSPQEMSVNLPQYLGGPRRTIMASATQSQPAFLHKGAELSPYTFYLVEGLRTGAADQDCDGFISVEEWYAYAKRKVKQEMPAIDPHIYNVKAVQGLALAQSPVSDPQFIYRKQFELYAEQGKVSPVNRVILDNLQTTLDLDADVAKTIEAEVSKPGQIYQRKLQEYAMAFVEAVRQEYPVSDYLQDQFRHFQMTLGLTDADTIPVESAIIRQVQVIQSPRRATEVPRIPTQNLTWPKSTVVHSFHQTFGFGHTLQLSAQHLATFGQKLSSNMGGYFHRSRNRITLPSLSLKQLQSVPKKAWWFAGGGAIALLLLLTLLHQQQLSQQRKQETQQLQFWQSLVQKKRYENCLSQTQGIPKDSSLYPQAQKLFAQCQAGVNWQNAQPKRIGNPSQQTLWSIALSPDGQTLIGGGNQNDIQLWNLKQGKLIQTLSAHTNQVWTIALEPKGKILASGSGDGTLKVWEVQTGQLLQTLPAHLATVWSVAISPDGKYVVSGSEDQTIKVWDVKTGALVRTLSGHSAQVRAVAISPNGQTFASASYDKSIKIWDLKTGKLIRTLKGHSGRVIAIAFSPTSDQLASASQDKTVKLWNLQSGQLSRTFTGHIHQVLAVAFSPDGNTLATASQDQTVKLWNLTSGELRRTLTGYQGDVYALAFSADGQSLGTTSKKGVIKVWHRD